ncbi:MAG: MoxR family ATPase [Bifidobacteriaceae bacterium]|jgi:MoxR-like ATPase|nr:MoxR family ATPase [Bifidobacteriaceae bacterium]
MTTSPPRPGETDPATPAPPVPDAPPAPGQVWRQIEQVAAALTANIERVIQGKHEAVGLAVAVMLAGGHLLIEDVPGVGKTMLARAMAASIQASVNRIQFTPDLLPSDITGASVYNSQTRVFEFEPGPVFANIVIGDEINRASPKTQSALLECMEEGQVTVDAQSHQLPDPFFVVATQNPIDMDGTFGLLEAQRDRFMARLQMGYPSAADEAQIVRARGTREPIDQLAPIASLELIREVVDRCRQVYVADAITDYAVAIVRGTRTDPALRLGASPRAAVQLVAVAKAFAATHGRGYVLPDDIDRLAAPVLSHRLLPATAARGQDVATHLEEVVRGIVHRVPVPVLQPGRTAPPSEGTGSAGPAAPATRRSVRGR